MRRSLKEETSADMEKQNASLPLYVLITPARNEAAFIDFTINSVIAQTVLPVKWVIVSDGSTDGTDDIVKKYAAEYKWIELVRMPDRTERHFAGKVYSFNAGYSKVKGLKFDIIGNLDADISFGTDYFEFLLERFTVNPSLGVAGTAFIEDSSVAYNYEFVNIEHVSGQCQLFRRACFEDIGGYTPVKGGGIDWIAVTTARMIGWKTRTFPEKTFVHHKRMGTGMSGVFMSRFRFGKQDYYLGGHPVWEVFRCLYQMTKKPFILGGMFLFSGYMWAFLKRVERPISRELIEFRRREQMKRIKKLFRVTEL